MTEETFKNVYFKQILRKLNEISLKLDGYKIGEKETVHEENLLPDFPIASLNDFYIFEEQLKNDQRVQKQYVSIQMYNLLKIKNLY